MLLVALAAPALGLAAEDNDLVRIPWMQPETALTSSVLVDVCLDVQGGNLGDRLCAGNLEVHRVPVRAYFWFVDARLAQVNLVFSSSAFDEVVKAISHRLGVEPRATVERRRTGAVTFTNDVRDWRTAAMSARASRQYFGYEGAAQAWLVAGPAVGDRGGALRYAEP